jgi:hypothetical protein
MRVGGGGFGGVEEVSRGLRRGLPLDLRIFIELAILGKLRLNNPTESVLEGIQIDSGGDPWYV